MTTNITAPPAYTDAELAELSADELESYQRQIADFYQQPVQESEPESVPEPAPETAIIGRADVDDNGNAIQVYDCDEPNCDRSFTTVQGLIMHRQRVHISDEQKAEWMRKRNETAARRRLAAANTKAIAAESSEVLAIIEQTHKPGTKEHEARRKRWRNAKHRGWSEERFEQRELERARSIVAGEKPAGPGRPPKEVTDRKKAAKKAVETRTALAQANAEAAKAEDIFNRIAAATRALVAPVDLYERFEEVAELRRHMLAFLNEIPYVQEN